MSNKVPLTELQRTREYGLLTDKQKKFIDTYLSNGYELIPAVRAAYNCKDDHTAKIMSYPLRRNFHVAMVLSIHDGDSPKEAFGKTLLYLATMHKPDSKKVQAARLYAEVMGWSRSKQLQAVERCLELGVPLSVLGKNNQNLDRNIETGLEKMAKQNEPPSEFGLDEFEE